MSLNVLGKDLANGTRTSSTYDAAGRLLEVFDFASDGSVISGFQYADDAAGNRTSAIDTDDNRTTWTYDDTYQLLTEFRTGTEPYRHTYTYDAVGNRTRKESTETTDYDYDAANRLLVERTSLERTTYTWDADGNQTGIEAPTGELTTNTWSSGSQIVRIERADGAVTTFTYGPVTRRAEYKRLSREDDAGTLVNRWDNDNIVQQTDDLGNVEAEYTLAPQPQGNLVSQQRGAESRFYHYDGRTNTSKVTDAAEVVTDELVLDAWGNVIFETAGTVENPFALMGQKLVFREDAMGSGKPSLWARQRWLDPAAGGAKTPSATTSRICTATRATTPSTPSTPAG